MPSTSASKAGVAVGRQASMTEHADRLSCLKYRRADQPFRYVDLIERIRLVDDPANRSVGHFYLETVHIMLCPACGHRQEHLHKRTPYAALREAQSQLDAHLLGKG